MRETGKEREELKASSPKTFINEEDCSLQCLSGAIIAKPPFQITKITKQTLLQWGKIRKKTKK